MTKSKLWIVSSVLATGLASGVAANGEEHFKASAKTAVPRPKLVVNSARDQILPFVYDGNGWSTNFVISNLDSHTIVVHMEFLANDGSALSLPLNGIGYTTALDVTIPYGGTYSIATSDIDAAQASGYAFMAATNGSDLFGAYGVTRLQSANLPDLEMSVPLTPIDENFFNLSFDNTNGYSTRAVLINSSSQNSAIVNLSVQDSQGNVLATDQITIAPYARYPFNLGDYYPVAGIVGNVYFAANGQQYVAGSALRIGPNQSLAIVPVQSLPR